MSHSWDTAGGWLAIPESQTDNGFKRACQFYFNTVEVG